MVDHRAGEAEPLLLPAGEHLRRLLRDTLASTGKAGVARVVIRTREYLCAVVPEGDALVLIGQTQGELGASIYLREVLGREDGAPPPVDLKLEKKTGDFVRDLIEATYPDDFRDYNKRMYQPGGFWRGNAAAQRIWKTESGKAVFTAPSKLSAHGFADAPGRYSLLTMRSNDQFNTTIYSRNDRYRGVRGGRRVVFVNPADLESFGLSDGDRVDIVSEFTDAEGHLQERRAKDFAVIAYSTPSGNAAAYYPETNPLVPLDHTATKSNTPVSKAIVIRLERA